MRRCGVRALPARTRPLIAAEHTERVTLATNVAIAFPRSPLLTAQIAWDLQQYSGGRFKLGIGTQVKGHNELRYSAWTAAPLPRLREYIQTMKAQFESFADPAKPDEDLEITSRGFVNDDDGDDDNDDNDDD